MRLRRPKPAFKHNVSFDSTVIHNGSYCGRSKVLEITFPSGKTYRYYDVPLDVYAALLADDSPGTYFHNHVSGKYAYKNLETGGYHPVSVFNEAVTDETKTQKNWRQLSWEF